MKTYIVNMKEIWIQPVRIKAKNETDAVSKVIHGEGEYIESGLEYSETLEEYAEWEVEEE